MQSQANEATSNKLIIVHGLPGSGKSTLSQYLAQKRGLRYIILSTDDIVSTIIYNIDFDTYNNQVSVTNDLYLWSMESIGASHFVNRSKCKQACTKKIPTIVVDNTNLTWEECYPYCQTALDHGYEVEFHEPTTEWANNIEECFKRNKHGVPMETLEKMMKKKQPLAYLMLRFAYLKRFGPPEKTLWDKFKTFWNKWATFKQRY